MPGEDCAWRAGCVKLAFCPSSRHIGQVDGYFQDPWPIAAIHLSLAGGLNWCAGRMP